MPARNTLVLLSIGTLLIITGVVVQRWWPSESTVANTAPTTVNSHQSGNTTPTATTNTAVPATPEPIPTTPTNTNTEQSSVVVPITGFFTRITKKPFGIHITPATSPVQPEKFSGYHTGADAETTPGEASTDIPIIAVAAGTVVFAGHVNGYGGVIIIKHTIDGEKLLSLYGHLRISSFAVQAKSAVTAGQRLAVLGTGYSSETDGERKHLHFGLIKGWTISYRGYVTTKNALSGWEDPDAWLKAHGAS